MEKLQAGNIELLFNQRLENEYKLIEKDISFADLIINSHDISL